MSEDELVIQDLIVVPPRDRGMARRGRAVLLRNCSEIGPRSIDVSVARPDEAEATEIHRSCDGYRNKCGTNSCKGCRPCLMRHDESPAGCRADEEKAECLFQDIIMAMDGTPRPQHKELSWAMSSVRVWMELFRVAAPDAVASGRGSAHDVTLCSKCYGGRGVLAN